MNAVLLVSKARKKLYDGIVKEMMDFSVVSNTPLVKSSFINKIEEINPHCVIIDNSVKFKDIDLDGFVCLLRLKVQSIRIIYNFGTTNEVDDEDFKNTLSFLQQQKIYDVIIDDNAIQSVIENPMRFGDIAEKIEKIKKEKEKLFLNREDNEQLKDEKKEVIPIKLDVSVLSENYSFDINKVTEIIDDGEDKKNNCITIAIMELQHHLGSTKTAFELAGYLMKQQKNPCVIMSDVDTYQNMLRFYRFKTTAATDGFSVGDIHVLPYTSLETAKTVYSHIIVDIGYFKPEYELTYRKSDIKIMMCSAAEWDLIHISHWLNYPKYAYTRDINYLFMSPKQRYVQLCKSLLRGNCISHRIDYTDESFNSKVYGLILKRYELSKPNANKKRKIMKLR